jgi:hypothetical protein
MTSPAGSVSTITPARESMEKLKFAGRGQPEDRSAAIVIAVHSCAFERCSVEIALRVPDHATIRSKTIRCPVKAEEQLLCTFLRYLKHGAVAKLTAPRRRPVEIPRTPNQAVGACSGPVRVIEIEKCGFRPGRSYLKYRATALSTTLPGCAVEIALCVPY